jgi:hypothetical protein
MLFTKFKKQTHLEKEIDAILDIMSKYPPDSEEYTAMATNLEKLFKAKTGDRTNFISKDTLIVVAGNLLGIALILGFEKVDVITSKAIGFVLRGRV